MTNAFDIAAKFYDHSFTNTKIGRLQRNRVWKYLDKVLPNNKALSILELNCGTGEDALYFAKKGHQTQVFDLANPVLNVDKKYDLIFSNFGGLNCISKNELKNLANFFKKYLTKNGQCIFVIMPPKTIIEKWYRWYKNETDIYKNRSSEKPIEVNVEGKSVATYFHSPNTVQSTFEGFQLIKKLPIGFIPSYLEKNSILPILNIFDSLIYASKSFSNNADHYLIHLKLGVD